MNWKKLADLPGQKLVGAYQIEFWCIRDGKVWHQGRKLTAADPSTFEIFEGSDFIARDAQSIFHAWSRLPAIDRNSFCKIGVYWRDADRVYFEFETSLKPLGDVDAKTFRELKGGYGADEKSAWYHGVRIKSCTHVRDLRVNPKDALYASDGEQVYFDGKRLNGARPDHWKIIGTGFSRDDKSVFYAERKLPRVDVETWQHVHRTWSKDKNHVFHMNLIEKGVSPEGFDENSCR